MRDVPIVDLNSREISAAFVKAMIAQGPLSIRHGRVNCVDYVEAANMLGIVPPVAILGMTEYST